MMQHAPQVFNVVKNSNLRMYHETENSHVLYFFAQLVEGAGSWPFARFDQWVSNLFLRAAFPGLKFSRVSPNSM